MSLPPKVRASVVILALASAVVFVGVAVTEINYVSGHPYAYGPAKVIAWAAGAGACISLAVSVLAVNLKSPSRPGAIDG